MPDPAALRQLALDQRDKGTVLHPSMSDYDGEMSKMWGGPPPRWFASAMGAFPKRFSHMAGRTALVTGGTGGIGFYVAKLLCRVGLTVVLPARPQLEHEAASAAAAITAAVPGATVLIPGVPLDLASFASVRAFGAHMRSLPPEGSPDRIDALVLNAGRGGSAVGANEASVDGHEVIMQVNLLSQALLSAELLPLLRRSDHARIVAQSSGARFNTRESEMSLDLGTNLAAVSAHSPWAQYSRSKAGACLLARALSRRLAASGVTGSAASSDPGLAATGVNVQHDLAATLGGRQPDTKALHDVAAHHAADGALPITLAALEGVTGGEAAADAFYSPSGSRARSLEDAAMRLDARQLRRGDPAAWGNETVEAFWQRLVEATPGLGDAWSAAAREGQGSCEGSE